MVRPILQLEQDVVVIDAEDQEFLFPADQLPDLPPIALEQGPNKNPQLNPPNQPLELLAEDVDQPNQQNPPAGQPNQENQPNQPNLPNQLQNPPAELPNQPNQPNPPNQLPNLPVNPPNPMADQQQLNWSYFKPEFSGKEEEDMEAHLLRTNDWMETHNFPDDAKVRRFCLTLMGEARLWYETLRAAQLDWDTQQECFRQQYSKFGSTREQYFHVWRSFHFDENVDAIDTYTTRIKQVAALLNYGEPQILELFKNTLPSKLYDMLYQIDDLRTAVETGKGY